MHFFAFTQKNWGKRLVKSPKLYIRDTGILHHLLGIPFKKKALLSHPKAGASFETFCIEQIINLARIEDPAAEAYFFRTQARRGRNAPKPLAPIIDALLLA